MSNHYWMISSSLDQSTFLPPLVTSCSAPLQASVGGEPVHMPEKPLDSPEPKGGSEKGPGPEDRERAGSPAPTKGESSSSQSKEPTAKASDPPSNESSAKGSYV